MRKATTGALNEILWRKELKQRTKMFFHNGQKMWPITNKIKDKKETVELNFSRRCLQVTIEEFRTEIVLRKMDITFFLTGNPENGKYADRPRTILKWEQKLIQN